MKIHPMNIQMNDRLMPKGAVHIVKSGYFCLRGSNQSQSEEGKKFGFGTFRMDFSFQIHCFGSNKLHHDCAPDIVHSRSLFDMVGYQRMTMYFWDSSGNTHTNSNKSPLGPKSWIFRFDPRMPFQAILDNIGASGVPIC